MEQPAFLSCQRRELLELFRGSYAVKSEKAPESLTISVLFNLAERVGFEPTVRCRITSFQDWLLKPLGHLSTSKENISFLSKIVKPFTSLN